MAGNEDVNEQRAVGTRQGFDVAYLKARFFLAAIYQPLKRLATIVTPRWGFVFQLVSIFAKLEIVTNACRLSDAYGRTKKRGRTLQSSLSERKNTYSKLLVSAKTI